MGQQKKIWKGELLQTACDWNDEDKGLMCTIPDPYYLSPLICLDSLLTS